MTTAAHASRLRSAQAEQDANDLNQVIAAAEQSILQIVGGHVSVEFALSANGIRSALSGAELERVVLGLCAAAQSALGSAGRLIIETRGVNEPPIVPSPAGLCAAAARPCVLVRAQQALQGAAPHALRQSSVGVPAPSVTCLEQLLERLGGRLEFLSLSNHELAYVAYLPLPRPPQSSSRLAAAAPAGAHVILLIEDEPQVQAVTARILRGFGYAVLTAWNEQTALAQAEQFGASIALLVSDLLLPGVSGPNLVRTLKKPCERARVLYISGYSEEQAGSLTEGASFLRKPFTAQELLAAIHELLPAAAF